MWKKILIIVFALIVVFSLSGVFSAFAFLGPPGNPPLNNNILQVTSSRAFVIATTTVISTQPQLIFRNLGNPGDIILFPSVGNDGKVGIGTTAPDERLHVSGNLKISGDSTITGTLSATNLVASGTLAGTLSAGYLSAGVFGLSSTKGNYTFQASGSTNPILFIDATNERVGVGTSSAAYTLDVLGQAYLRGTSTVAGATGLFVNSLGRVGIGTTTQTSPLHIWSGISGIIQSLDSTASVSYLQFHNSSTGYNSSSDGLTVGVNGSDAYVYNREAGSLYLGTNDTSRINIDSNGRVGIGGNSSAPYRLYVASGPVLFRNTLLNPTFYVNDETTVKIGIATTTPSYTLDVVGTAQFSQPIIIGTPTIDSHATTKSYVDSILTGGTATGTLANLTVTGTTTLATAGGRVGIGTTTPASSLVIVGDAPSDSFGQVHIYNTSVSTQNTGLTVTAPNGSNALLRLRAPTNADARPALVVQDYLSTGSSSLFGLERSSSKTLSSGSRNDLIITNSSNDRSILFGTTNSGTLAERVRINYDGSVGIATTTPASLFTVASSTGSANFFQVNSVGNIIAGSGGLSQWQSSSTAFTFNTPVNLGNIVTASDLGSHTLYNQPVTSASVVGTNVGPTFSIDSNPVLTIYGESDGNGGAQNLRVGIGDTTPSYTLDVVGTAQFSQPIIVGTPTIDSHATTKSYVDSVLTGGTATGTLANLTVTGTTTLATAGGRVGIGTTTPSYILDIAGEGVINVYGASANRGLWQTKSGDGAYKTMRFAGNDVSFWTATSDGGSTATEKVTIKHTTGYVGIGTTTPSKKLDIVGKTRIQGTGFTASALDYDLNIVGNTNSTSTYPHLMVANRNQSGNSLAKIGFNAGDGAIIAAFVADLAGYGTGQDYTASGLDSPGAGIQVYGNYPFMIKTNNVERLRVTNAGSVGVGTSSPVGKLEVIDTAAGGLRGIVSTQISASNHGAYFSFRKSRGSVGSPATVVSGDDIGSINGWAYDGTNFLNTAAVLFDTSGVISADSVPTRIAFYAGTNSGNLSEKMTITSDGYVGIATTTPSYALDVVGTAQFSQPIIVGTPTIAGHATTKSYVDSVLTGGTATGTLANLIVTGTTTLATAGGNVGIGTTNPNAKLMVQTEDSGADTFLNGIKVYRSTLGTAAAGLATGISFNLENDGGSEGTASYIRTLWESAVGASEDSAMTFGTRLDGAAVAERMRITSAGNVGIGTTTPASKFVVAGSKVNFQVLDTGSLSLLGADEGAGAATDFIIRTGANNTNSPNIILQKGRSNSGMAIGSGDNMGSIKFYGGTGSAFAEGARIRGDAEGTFTTSSLPSALTFWTAPSGSNAVVERMRITNAGSVGIGTTTPQSDLHIYDQSSSVVLDLDANGTGGDDYRFVSSVDSSSIGGGKLGILHGDSGVYRMVINDSGYVGIATTTPSYGLDVVGTAQFSQPILVGTPTLSGHAATKSYVDSSFTGGTATGTLASLVVTGTTTLQGTTVLTGLSGVLKTSAGVISGSATTDDLTEGVTNKYFSNTQARNALSGTSPINYSQTTGVIALNTVPVGSGGTGTTTLTGMLKGNGANAFSGVTGTANYLTKWSDANTISTSTLYESGGNVGIGTTSLPFRLSVLGDTTIRFGVHTTDYIGVNGSAFGIRMGTSTGNTYSELLALSAGGSAWNNLILQSGGGSVGIGTTTPSNNFQVAGTVKLTSGGGDFSIDDSGNFVIQL